MIRVSSLAQLKDVQAKLGIKPRRNPPQEREHIEQCAVIEWVRMNERKHGALKLLYAIPNGGKRSKAIAGKLRAEGVKAGVPDLCLPVACRGYHGLYLEMKGPKGSVSEKQSEMLTSLSLQGYCAAVAFGAAHGQAVLEWYIGLSDNEPSGII